jgi:DNA-directed RNA polymerase alpha subunit
MTKGYSHWGMLEDLIDWSVEPQRLWTQPIWELELNVRAANRMREHGIEYIGDLVSLTEADILNWLGVGASTLAGIKHGLALKGLRLGMNAWPLIRLEHETFAFSRPGDIKELSKQYCDHY